MRKQSKILLALGLGLATVMSAAHAAHPGHDRGDDRRSDRYDDRYDKRDDRRSDRNRSRDQRRYASGEWRLDPRRCPDLREDRRDRRYDNGRRDRREDRRDERVTRCPSSAWVWVSDQNRGRGYARGKQSRYDRAYIPARPGYNVVYRNRDGNFYARYNGRDVRIGVVVR